MFGFVLDRRQILERLKIGIIRRANIFGPNDKNLKRIIPETITSIIKGKKLKIRSNGKSLKALTFHKLHIHLLHKYNFLVIFH